MNPQLVCLVSLVACAPQPAPSVVTVSPVSSSARPPAGTRPPPVPFVNALIAMTCGPTDGPATTLKVANGPLSCNDWRTLHRFAVVETWDVLHINAGRTESLPGAHGGTVRLCVDESACVDETGAKLRVEQRTGDGFTGVLVIYRGDNVEESLPIHAVNCDLDEECG